MHHSLTMPGEKSETFRCHHDTQLSGPQDAAMTPFSRLTSFRHKASCGTARHMMLVLAACSTHPLGISKEEWVLLTPEQQMAARMKQADLNRAHAERRTEQAAARRQSADVSRNCTGRPAMALSLNASWKAAWLISARVSTHIRPSRSLWRGGGSLSGAATGAVSFGPSIHRTG